MRLRLPISSPAAGGAAGFSAVLRFRPDEGRQAYHSLSTAVASVRPQRPFASPRRLALPQKRREWPCGGTMEAAMYTGLGDAHVHTRAHRLALVITDHTSCVASSAGSTTHPPPSHGAREHLLHNKDSCEHFLQGHGAHEHLLHGLGAREYLMCGPGRRGHLPQGDGQRKHPLLGHGARFISRTATSRATVSRTATAPRPPPASTARASAFSSTSDSEHTRG